MNAFYLDNTAKIVALNMTSSNSPGGGVERGASAQEESIFRRTNYFLTLKSGFYRLLNGSNVFSPNVSIIKNPEFEDIHINSIISVAFIAASAIKYPDLVDVVGANTKNNDKEKYSQKDKQLMTTTIDNIFRTAYLAEKDTLVLGALGCGAYHNPQREVIEIFNSCLKKYDKCFKSIIFAVFSKKDKNYDLFNKFIVRL